MIGLSIAYVLAREGVAATVLDRRELGREASWAGAGMIPPYTERLATHPTVALRSWSAPLHPEWSAALQDETGIDNGYHRTGGVDVACDGRGGGRAAVDGRPVAGRGDRLRAARPRRLRPGRAGAEPGAAGRLLPARPRPDPQPQAPPGAGPGGWRAGASLRPGEAVRGFETAAGRVRPSGPPTGRIPCGCGRRGRGLVGRPARRARRPGPDAPAQGADRAAEVRSAAPPADRRARQELHGPARRRPHPGRCDRGRRRLRHPDDLARASATCSTRRSALCPAWPRPRSSGPGRACGPGSIDTRPYLGDVSPASRT